MNVRKQINKLLDKCNNEELEQIYKLSMTVKPVVEEVRVVKKVSGDVKVDFLCGSWMHLCANVANWVYSAHFSKSKTQSPDSVLSSIKVCYAAQLPMRLVAVIDKELVGTASVHAKSDCGRYAPNICWVVVPKEYKKLKVEDKLINRCKEVAKSMGHKEIYYQGKRYNL